MIDRYLTADIVDDEVLSANVEDEELQADSPDLLIIGDPQGSYIPIPPVGQVGQTIVVSGVDENGRPTQWQAEDFPTIRGEKGEKGDKGDKGDTGLSGKDGYTPIKSKDYFTEEDVQEIVDKVAEEMPTPVTSWNDLTDKPFGESPPAFDIAWNGDMTGHDTFLLEENVYLVKVSDEVFTKEQLLNSTMYFSDGGDYTLIEEDIFVYNDVGLIELGDVFVVFSAETLIGAMGFPEGSVSNGVWFINVAGEGGYYVNRFVASSTIKTIDEKFLPTWDELKNKPFGEIPPAFDIQWDGNMTGRETLANGEGEFFVKVSDEVLTKEQLLNATYYFNDGYVETILEEDIQEVNELGIIQIFNDILVVTSANDFINGAGLPEGSVSNGVWFMNITDASGAEDVYYINRLVAPTIVKKIDSEYLDLEGFAKTEDLEGYAKTEDLEGFAKTEDLEGYAKTEDLEGFAKTEDLSAVATSGSWNDLEDKPFGEGPSRWVEVVSQFKVTPTQADDGSYTATVELSFTPKDGTKYKIIVTDGQWPMVIYEHECVCEVTHNHVMFRTRYYLGESGDPVRAYSSVPSNTIPTQWTFEFQSYNGQSGYRVEIHEAKPTLILLDEKFLSETVVLESELDAKGYQTEAQVTALINNALGVIENGTY
jgi:hypothetical protein